MPTVDVYNQDHEQVSTIDLDEGVFAAPIKEHLFHLVVRYQRARKRAGTHAVRTRTQVRGGGRKPWRQKGTGRARHGTIRSPIWRGGGVVHGPHNRTHEIRVPKKVRRAAMRSALSRRLEDGSLWVLDRVHLEEMKTRLVKVIADRFGWDEVLVVVRDPDEKLLRAARNLPNVKVVPVEGLNVYDILNHRNLALTVDAVELVTERYGR